MRLLPALLLCVSFSACAEVDQRGTATAQASAQPASQSANDEPNPNELPGAEEVQAMARAYPSRIDDIAVRDAQWALEMDGTWYYWAGGRLLPEEHLHNAQEFVGVRFYDDYQLGPPKPEEISPELEARLRERTRNRFQDDRMRFNAFMDSLYEISSRAEAERKVESVQLFGKWTRVHPLLVKPLERVDRVVEKLVEQDPEVRRFIERLHQIHGYNWRNISGTPRRSYHSYGIAVDLVPYRYDSGYAYWQWAASGGVEEWWELTFDQRWNVPQPIIDAFEAHGFIWGGKWLFFDNLHFEYRPETILMARNDGDGLGR